MLVCDPFDLQVESCPISRCHVSMLMVRTLSRLPPTLTLVFPSRPRPRLAAPPLPLLLSVVADGQTFFKTINCLSFYFLRHKIFEGVVRETI